MDAAPVSPVSLSVSFSRLQMLLGRFPQPTLVDVRRNALYASCRERKGKPQGR